MSEPKHPVVLLRDLVRRREGQSDLAAVPVDLGLLRKLLARLDLPPERRPGRVAWDEAFAVARAIVAAHKRWAGEDAIRQAFTSLLARLEHVAEDARCARCGLGFLVADRTGGVDGAVRVKVGDAVYHGGCADALDVDGEWV